MAVDVDELIKVIGPNVRKYREKAGLTQYELAERVSVSSAFISKVECGKKAMKLKTLYDIADALRVGMDALVYEGRSSLPIQNIQRMLEGKSLEFVSGVEDIVRICVENFGKEEDKK